MFADVDVGEAELVQHLRPACARQAPGNSTGPQVDLPERLLGDGSAVGYVRELQGSAWPQDPADFVERGPLVGTQVEDAVRDDDVGPIILDRERLGESVSEL